MAFQRSNPGVARFLGVNPRQPTILNTSAVRLPVIHGGIRGEKELIRGTTGKKYDDSKILKTFDNYLSAVHRGDKTYVDAHGKEQAVGNVTKYQQFLARKIGSGKKDITSRQGTDQAFKGLTTTMDAIGAHTVAGGSGTNTTRAGKIREKFIPEPKVDKAAERKESLAHLTASIKTPLPSAKAPATARSTPSTPPSLQAVSPIGNTSPSSQTAAPSSTSAPTHSGGAPFSSSTLTGTGVTGNITQVSKISSVSLGIPLAGGHQATADTGAPAAMAPVSSEAPVAPPTSLEDLASGFQDPDPLPVHPPVPSAEPSVTPSSSSPSIPE